MRVFSFQRNRSRRRTRLLGFPSQVDLRPSLVGRRFASGGGGCSPTERAEDDFWARLELAFRPVKWIIMPGRLASQPSECCGRAFGLRIFVLPTCWPAGWLASLHMRMLVGAPKKTIWHSRAAFAFGARCWRACEPIEFELPEAHEWTLGIASSPVALRLGRIQLA